MSLEYQMKGLGMKQRLIQLTVCGLAALVYLSLNGCGSSALQGLDGGSAAQDGGAAGPDGGAEDGGLAGDGGLSDGGLGYHLNIYVKGDLTPKTFNDGFSGQTPSNFHMGLARFDLMTSPTDPSPVTVFDHGANYVEVDMLGETLAGKGDLRNIPPATYTHGRALITMSRFDIQTMVHVASPPVTVQGTVSVLTALSGCTLDGLPRSPGWAKFTFHLTPYNVSRIGTLPSMPSTGGGTIVRDNDKTWMVFPISPALLIVPNLQTSPKITIVFDVFESFRWQDLSTAGYTQGVFDTESSGGWEPVKNFGATDYHIEQ